MTLQVANELRCKQDITCAPRHHLYFAHQRSFADVAELDGPSPSGWSDNVKCYRIGLPTGEAESMQESGASSSEHTYHTC